MNKEQIIPIIANAARDVLKEKWYLVDDEFYDDLQFLAKSIEAVVRRYKRGEITKSQARKKIEIRANAIFTSLTLEKAISKTLAKKAVNSVFEAIREAVNSFIGFDVIPEGLT